MKGRYILISTVVLGLSLVTCTKEKSPTRPNAPDPSPAGLSLSPLTGAPASVVTVSGYSVDTSLAGEFSIHLGGEPAPFCANEDSSLTLMVPLFLDSTGWSTPPANPVKIELRFNDSVVAVTDSSFQVQPLVPAPGTTALIHQAAEDVVEAVDNLWSNLPVSEEWHGVVRQAVSEMMGSLIREGDSSLAAILNGTSSVWQGEAVDLALVDAIMASSGTLDLYTALADGLNRSRDSMTTHLSASSSLYCDGDGADMDLACQMQIYVILRDFTEMVVIPTAETYNNTVGLVAGLAAISGVGTLPGLVAEIIGALLQIESFIMDKVVVATLPSHIQTFVMTSAGDTIDVGESTNTNLIIAGANTPVAITANDIVTTILAAMPFLNAPSSERFTAVLLRAAQFVIDQYRGILLQYEQMHPGTFDDIALTQIPPMMFGPAEITHGELVQLFSDNPAIVAPDEPALEWQGIAKGQAVVRAQTRAAGAVKVVRDWMFLSSYTGGAFGEDVAATPNRQITVGKLGSLEVVVEGLPSGVDADILVTHPDGSDPTQVTASETLSGLATGTHTVDASEVETNDHGTFVPEQASQTALVAGDSTTTVTVTYKEKFGKIHLVISGLPDGVDADVTITGPNAYSKSVTESLLVDSLIEGTYTIRAAEVSDGADTYEARPDSQQVEVYSGQTAAAGVQYGSLSMSMRFGRFMITETQILGADIIASNSYPEEVQSYSPGLGEVIVGPLEWLSGCELGGGLPMEMGTGLTYGTDGAVTGASGSSHVIASSVAAAQEITIEVGAVADASPIPVDPGGSGTSHAQSAGYLPGSVSPNIVINNPSSQNAAIVFEWMHGTTTADRGVAGLIFQYWHWSACGSSRVERVTFLTNPDGSPRPSGVDTVQVSSGFGELILRAHANANAFNHVGHPDIPSDTSYSNSGSASSYGRVVIRLISLD